MKTRTVRLDGMRLENQEFFVNFNWDNFQVGDKVFTEDNTDLDAAVVYYRGHNGVQVFLTTNRLG